MIEEKWEKDGKRKSAVGWVEEGRSGTSQVPRFLRQPGWRAQRHCARLPRIALYAPLQARPSTRDQTEMRQLIMLTAAAALTLLAGCVESTGGGPVPRPVRPRAPRPLPSRAAYAM